jgi:uncharacterized alkaline shock family protein YloU
VPTDQPTGRLLVSRQAIVDIVRSATLGSYGVAGFAASLPVRVLGRLGLTSPGIRLGRRDGHVSIDLFIDVAPGLPIAEVARQVDSAIRYALQRALGRETGPIAVHVDRLRFETTGDPAPGTTSGPPTGAAAEDLAGSGSDVA